MDLPVIIIGAGASGLMAASELSAAGYPVTILEAAAIPGGRIRTLDDKSFTSPAECGAEFVHGSLPLTLELLHAAGITYRPTKGQAAQVRKGVWLDRDPFAGNWDIFMEKMGRLEQDISIAAFLDSNFPGETYAALRDSIRGFAEGYDLADINKASTLALFKEWQEEGGTEFRVDGGYGRMIQYLHTTCRTHGCQIAYSSPAQRVDWLKDKVIVTTAGGATFTGSKLIVTASLGVLQLQETDSGALSFFPPIPAYKLAVHNLGYGSVVKILLEFNEAFWAEKAKGIGFILSDETVPTWWTQSPDTSNLLTAWLTGQAMEKFQALSETEKITSCLQSLSNIFSIDVGTLGNRLLAIRINDWATAPFIRGGYSYETVSCASARQLLQKPIEDTLFFAGEALYDGSALATVEAALTTGLEVAKKIMAQP